MELNEIFRDSSPAPEAEKASPAVAAEAPKIEEVKPEVKAEAEVKPEVKVETKAEEKPVVAKAEEKPAEVKAPEEAKKEEAPKFDWESADNPYKKRYTDTRDWSTRVNQENAEFKRQLGVINKKLDGTYDPAKDEPAPVAPEVREQWAELAGKSKASKIAAYSISEFGGQEAVDKGIQEWDARFKDNQAAQMRLLSSDAPVVEALKMLKEVHWIEKHGADPDKIEASIRKQVETELTTKITEEVTKQIMGRLKKQEGAAQTLTEVRGAGKEAPPVNNGPTPLTSIFA